MKRLVALIFGICVISGVLLFFWVQPSEKQLAPSIQTPQAQETQQSVANVQEQPGLPLRISIPSIGVNAAIESVGMDEKRAMDVPKEPMNTAWYNLGYKPGEIGSAVIAGHVDTPTGAPAVFAKLGTLPEGAEITVSDDKGTEHTFFVTDTKIYAYDAVPLQQVFDDQSGKKLHLITCSGVWDTQARNYTTRTVVFATMQE